MNLTSRKNCITWDIALFFALYVVMPNYFALELSGSLPLLTINRALLLLVGLMLVIRHRSKLLNIRSFRLKDLKALLLRDPMLRVGLLIYLGLMLTANLAFLLQIPSATIRAMFTLIVEQYVLVWVLTVVIDTREKLLQCLKVLVCSAGVVGVISIISVIIDYNLFHHLNVVSRQMMMSTYYRRGVLRASAGFGHPVYYGAFCAVILPLNMYLVEESEKLWQNLLYGGCMVANLAGLCLSNSRGSLLAFGCMMVVIIPIKLIMRFRLKDIVRYVAVFAVALALLYGVSSTTPAGTGYLKDIANSVLTEIFPMPEDTTSVEKPGAQNPDDSAQAPENPDDSADATAPTDAAPEDPDTPQEKPKPDFGSNKNGVWSRTVQLSGIRWTLQRSPLFGFGFEAQKRGAVQYEFRPGVWWSTGTFDIAVVSIIGQHGLVGLLAYLCLAGSILITMLRKKVWKDRLMMTFFFCFATLFLCLLSISSLEKTMWVLIGLFVCLINILPNKEKEIQAQTA